MYLVGLCMDTLEKASTCSVTVIAEMLEEIEDPSIDTPNSNNNDVNFRENAVHKSPRSNSLDETNLFSNKGICSPLSVSGYIESPNTSSHEGSSDLTEDNINCRFNRCSLTNVLLSDGSALNCQNFLSPNNEDLVVKVEKPEKIINYMETYISFRVSTKTTRSEFLHSTYEVHRRYNDFSWLRNKLDQDFPLYFIPTLPEKHSLYSLDRFDPEFIRSRCFLLHLFLQSLSSIHKLKRNNDLRAFLTLNTEDWSNHRKTEGYSMLNSLVPKSESHLPVALTPESKLMMGAQQTDFKTEGSFCSNILQTSAALDKMTSKCNKTNVILTHDLTCILNVLSHWAESEKLTRLKTSANCAVAAVQEQITALVDMNSKFDVFLCLPLKHAVSSADGAKVVLKRRETIENEEANIKETLRRKNVEKDVLLKYPRNGAKTDAKINKVTQQLGELEEKCAVHEKKLREANSMVCRELSAWHSTRQSSSLNWLRNLMAQNIQYHRRSLEAWEKALEEMDSEFMNGGKN